MKKRTLGRSGLEVSSAVARLPRGGKGVTIADLLSAFLHKKGLD